VNGDMVSSSVVPAAGSFSFTAASDDGVIQLVLPKNYSDYGNYAIDYTGTASLEGIIYSLLFRYHIATNEQ